MTKTYGEYVILLHDARLVSRSGADWPRQPGNTPGIYTRERGAAARWGTRGQAMAAARRMTFLWSVPFSIVKLICPEDAERAE